MVVEKVTAEVAKLSFEWTEFFGMSLMFFGVMIALRFFLPNKFLQKAKVKQFLLAVPVIAGAMYGAVYWPGLRGAMSGIMWGSVCGLCSHVTFKAVEITWLVFLRVFPQLADGWGAKIAAQLGMTVKPAEPAAPAKEVA